MSFLFPQQNQEEGITHPPTPPTPADPGVALSGAQARQAAAAAAGSVSGFAKTTNTGPKGVPNPQTAAKTLFAA